MILDSQWIYRLLKTLIMAGGRERERKRLMKLFSSVFFHHCSISLSNSPQRPSLMVLPSLQRSRARRDQPCSSVDREMLLRWSHCCFHHQQLPSVGVDEAVAVVDGGHCKRGGGGLVHYQD